MDNNNIAILQDYQSSIDASFKKMDKLSNEFPTADQSQRNLIMNNFNNELSSSKTNIGLMKMELSTLKEEGNLEKWQEIISTLQTNYDSYKESFKMMKYKVNNVVEDPQNIDAKVDLSKMSSQQVMDRGTNILAEDRNAINRMKKIVNQDYETMKDVNRELLSQNEKLENADKELKEIDYSLNRAGKQMKMMAKMYATDKLIMCMIFCILLVILAIIVVSFLIPGDDDSSANSQHDSFTNGDKTNSSSFYNNWKIIPYIFLLLISYLY